MAGCFSLRPRPIRARIDIIVSDPRDAITRKGAHFAECHPGNLPALLWKRGQPNIRLGMEPRAPLLPTDDIARSECQPLFDARIVVSIGMDDVSKQLCSVAGDKLQQAA